MIAFCRDRWVFRGTGPDGPLVLPPMTEQPRRTYARARLYLGISYVGTLVLACSVSLWLGLPNGIYAASTPGPGSASELITLGLFVLLYVALGFPFDMLGGHILPRWYGRTRETFSHYVTGWFPAAVGHGVLLMLSATVLLYAARYSGEVGFYGMAVTLMLILVAAQLPLAQFIAGLTTASTPAWLHPLDPQGRLLNNQDRGFTGGVVGLPGFERSVLPATWLEDLPRDQLEAAVIRRRHVRLDGPRAVGLFVGLAWNLVGLLVCVRVIGIVPDSVPGLLTLSCAITLWSFAGLLILPSLSRPGVFRVDAAAVASGVQPDLLAQTIVTLDSLQDDEPNRPRLVETIFHPIPAASTRIDRLRALGEREATGVAAWHAARMSLYLSIPCFGLLSRAVHCNAGRPELWAMLPCD